MIKPSMEGNTTTPWMDRAWMQEVLRGVEKDPSLTISDYNVRNISSKGDHYLSEMYRITIHLQRAGNKESKVSLLAKKLPQGNEIQKNLAESSAFPNEIKVFSKILPKYKAILQDVAPERLKPFAARHICSQNNYPYFLIVSDLAPEGFRLANRQQGLDLDHCLLVMRELGRYHAASVALHDSNPKLIETFKENMITEESSIEFLHALIKPSIISLAKFVRLWPDGGERMANKLLKVVDTYYQQMKQQLSPEDNRLNVLIHGDLWVNNLLFKYSDVTGGVEDVRLVDFQMSCYSSCAIDLQYFIHTSPRDDVRVAHTEDILREYHNELCSTLQLLGQAKKAMSFQELMDEYERKGVYGFLMSVFVLPVIIADTENATDVEAILSGGDHTESSDNRVANKEFVEIMKRILPVSEQKGYF